MEASGEVDKTEYFRSPWLIYRGLLRRPSCEISENPVRRKPSCREALRSGNSGTEVTPGPQAVRCQIRYPGSDVTCENVAAARHGKLPVCAWHYWNIAMTPEIDRWSLADEITGEFAEYARAWGDEELIRLAEFMHDIAEDRHSTAERLAAEAERMAGGGE